MEQETNLYLISNGSMNIFPDNKRSHFVNRMVKPLALTKSLSSYFYITLDSITIENSIIQYPIEYNLPDLICFNQSIEDKPSQFTLPEIHFESIIKFLSFLRRNCIGEFLKEIEVKNNRFTLQSNGKYTFISIRFFEFLQLDQTDNLRILGQNWLDGRFKYYYGKYYVLEAGYFKTFNASQKFDLNKNVPSIIKIVSPNIKQYLSGGSYTNVLSTFPLDHSKRTTFFVRKNKEFFILNTEFLSDISIQLIDEKNYPVQFTPGPPSIIRVRLKEMSNFLENFHIQISSNDSNAVFPENRISSFKSKLPKSVDFSDNWSIALTRIYFPSSVLRVIPPFNYIKIKKESKIGTGKKQNFIEYESVLIPNSVCNTVMELIKVLNISIKNFPLKFKLYNEKISIISKFRKNYVIKEVIIHPKLACMLGFEKSKTLFDKPDVNISISIPPLKEKNKKRYIFTHLPDLDHVLPPYVFLYCNIVTKTVIANTPVPLLKVIPVNFSKDVQEKGIFHEFEHLEYFNVQPSTVQTIEFEVRSHDGDLIVFEKGDILLTITFKKN